MQSDEVKKLAILCAREEWVQVKKLADRLVADHATQARFFQAIARFHLGEHLAAWFCAERALDELPDSAEVLDLCGRIAAALRDAEASEAFHQRAIVLAEDPLLAPLTYNAIGSLMRLGQWSAVAREFATHGTRWGSSTRRSLEISIMLSRPEGLDLEAVRRLAAEIGTRPPHAHDVAIALHQLGAWEEADRLLAKCQLAGNETLISANRLLLLLDAKQNDVAYRHWKRERQILRLEPHLADALQGVLLAALGSNDAAHAHFSAARPYLRKDQRLLAVRDGIALAHFKALEALDRRSQARRALIRELQSTLGDLPRTLSALRTSSDAAGFEGSPRLQVWEIEYQRDGDHWVKAKVNAMTAESARILVAETLPEGLQALPFAVCRIVDEAPEGGLGVLERHIGYRVSREIMP